MKQSRSRLWIAVPLAMMAAIQVVSGIPPPGHFAEPGEPWGRATVSRILFAPGHQTVNLLHVPVFAALSWLWCLCLGPWTPSKRRAAVVSAGISLAFAVANELSQIAVPSRFASLGDASMNALGVVIGLVAFRVTGRGSAAALGELGGR